MWIKREISHVLQRTAVTFPALVLTGARQVGKTSLLTHLYPRHSLVTLDLPSHAELAENRPEEFLKKFPPPVIIDEVQYAPKIFRHLKAAIDRDRKNYGRFLLTGSQKFTLMKSVSDSLAGRCALLEMETLAWGEAAASQALSDLEMILKGGFPELHARPELNPQTYFQSYLATYLERDVRSLLQVGQLRDFERFIRVGALRSGQIINKAEMARDTGISPTTANDWLSVLQASNQVFLLEPWFSNKTKTLVKSPKLYLADTGLLCYLLGLETKEEMLRSPFLGAIWETFVFSELRKKEAFARGKWDIWFWRDARKLEADFLLHRGGRFVLLEAKFTEAPEERDFEKLRKVEEGLGKKNVDRKIVLCRTPSNFFTKGDVEVMPVTDFH